MIKNLLRKLKPFKSPKDKAIQKFFSIKLKKTDIVIECGANVGNITNHLSKMGAIVYAFEPNPFAFKILQKRFSGKENIMCYQKAVLDRNDTLKLFMHEWSNQNEVKWSTGSSLLDFKGNVQKDNFIEIDTIDLVKFIQDLKSNIKLLKLDVEGVECPIVKKIINTGLYKKIEYIFVETHEKKVPELMVETEELRDLINSLNINNINLDWK